MFLSELIVKAIHDDRMREVERAARDHERVAEARAARDGAAVPAAPSTVHAGSPARTSRRQTGLPA